MRLTKSTFLPKIADASSSIATWSPDALAQVVEKLKRGEYAGAVILLRLFLSDKPTVVNIMYNLGMALSDMGQLAEAQEHLRTAVNLVPDFTNARIALGVALQRQGTIWKRLPFSMRR